MRERFRSFSGKLAFAGLLPFAFFLLPFAFGQNDQEALEGAWQMVSGKSNGNQVPDDLVRQTELVFAKDKLTGKIPGIERSASYRIDPSHDPRWIDITVQGGPRNGKTFYGIYELEGDSLRLCLSRKTLSSDRPTEFVSTRSSDTELLELRRVQEKK
jgi:uncharacterized protein (TIGR03067 family)